MESTQRRLCIPRQQMPNYDFMYIIIITFFFFFWAFSRLLFRTARVNAAKLGQAIDIDRIAEQLEYEIPLLHPSICDCILFEGTAALVQRGRTDVLGASGHVVRKPANVGLISTRAFNRLYFVCGSFTLLASFILYYFFSCHSVPVCALIG